MLNKNAWHYHSGVSIFSIITILSILKASAETQIATSRADCLSCVLVLGCRCRLDLGLDTCPFDVSTQRSGLAIVSLTLPSCTTQGI